MATSREVNMLDALWSPKGEEPRHVTVLYWHIEKAIIREKGRTFNGVAFVPINELSRILQQRR